MGAVAARPWKTTAAGIFTGRRFGRTASHLDTNQSNCGSRAGAPGGPQASKVRISNAGFRLSLSSTMSSTFVTVNSQGRTVGQSWDRVKSILRLTRPSEIFQLSPPSLLFGFKTLAFGNICREE